MSNGKGSGRRPAAIDETTFESNWEKTFGKKSDELTTSFLLRTLAQWYERAWKKEGGEQDSDADDVRYMIDAARKRADDLDSGRRWS